MASVIVDATELIKLLSTLTSVYRSSDKEATCDFYISPEQKALYGHSAGKGLGIVARIECTPTSEGDPDQPFMLGLADTTALLQQARRAFQRDNNAELMLTVDSILEVAEITGSGDAIRESKMPLVDAEFDVNIRSIYADHLSKWRAGQPQQVSAVSTLAAIAGLLNKFGVSRATAVSGWLQDHAIYCADDIFIACHTGGEVLAPEQSSKVTAQPLAGMA